MFCNLHLMLFKMDLLKIVFKLINLYRPKNFVNKPVRCIEADRASEQKEHDTEYEYISKVKHGGNKKINMQSTVVIENRIEHQVY